MTVQSDGETDRILSLRLAETVPLPPEVCLSNREGSKTFFRRRTYYALMGVDDHPVIRLLESFETQANMAAVIDKAGHLDRMAHYSAWRGDALVKTVDLCREDAGKGAESE